MRRTSAVAAGCAAFLIVGLGFKPSKSQPQKDPTPVTSVAKKKPERCLSARIGVAYYRFQTHRWQRKRGGPYAGGLKIKGRSCSYARYAANEWRSRMYAARRSYERWAAFYVLPPTPYAPGARAWERAVRIVQRAYPGTAGWLLSCSDSEGGWGRWVPNSQGSGVGGWLQFMPSTFTRMFYASLADVTARGFIVPPQAHSWYSPLGQALAGAWGVTNGRRHEWAGSGC